MHHLHTWLTRVVTSQDVGSDNDFNARATRNQSLANAVYRLGNWTMHEWAGGPDDRVVDDPANAQVKLPLDAMPVGRVLMVVKLLCLTLLLTLGFRVSRDENWLGRAAAFGLACVLTLIVSPLSWGHHYTLLLPAALLVPLWLWREGCERAARTLSISAVTLVAAHYFLLDWTGASACWALGSRSGS